MARSGQGPASRRRRARFARALLTALVGLWLAAPAAGEDVVHLKPTANGGAARQLRGEIADYNGRELRLKTAGGRERVIPAEQIARIETARSAEQMAGDAAFARGDFAEALEHYRLALAATREPRDWMRRQVLVQIVWCLRNLNRLDQAGDYFLILLSRDPATRDFDAIPLVWTDAAPAPALAQKAATWLNDRDNSAANLMGASALLAGNQHDAALAALRRLAADADPRIAWLAQAQLWRAAAGQASPAQLRQWSQALETADPTLRAGACYVVGSLWAKHDAQTGAIWLMKVPILYPRERPLAAAALLAAGGCLEKTGEPQQAARLYRELVREHGYTPEAAQARGRLESLASGGSARDN